VRRIALAILSTVAALVLLFAYRTSRGPASRSTTGTAAPPGVVSQPGVTPSSTGIAGTAGTDGSPTVPGGGHRTVTANGNRVDTVQGPVQVHVTITDGRIVDIIVLVRPTGGPHHDEVNNYALPLLREQALRSQSAEIDGVSGATATSGGYRSSLQSALDAANGR
jgi:major membrane immunogen (membrane-anchored lipoprotein)